MKLAFLSSVLLAMLTQSNIALAEGESSGNRPGKTGYVALEAIGLTLMPVSGFRGGYFISPDLTAELSYASGGATLGDFEAKKTVIEAKAKYFLGNSFYIDGGLAQESWAVTYPVMDAGGSTSSNLSGSVSNTGLVFHIGNQWQWSGFTLGCDWLGYFASLSSSASFDGSTTVDEADKKKEEDDVKSTMGGGSAHVTRFYLGWSF